MKKDYKLQIIDYKIGLRTYKTGLAVFICLILTFPFAHHVALFSSLAAVICMKETNKDTLAAGTNRMFGTIIGGVLAYIYLSLVSAVSFLDGWPSKIIISALIIVCIYLCNIFKMKVASVICCAVFLVVVLAHHDNAKVLTYVGIRVLATLLGIAVSIVVNRFIAPLANTSNDTEESK